MSLVIIGGGITGLAAAYRASQANLPITLIEPGPLGGLLRTERIQGCTVECGADSWIRAKPWLADLAREIGIGGEIIGCNEPFRRTHIVRGGRLVPLPRGMKMIAPSEWPPLLASSLLGWKTKLSMLAETRRRPAAQSDRSIADFVLDHFGAEALDYLAEPLFAGVYGGTPENLGVAAAMPRMFEYERKFGSLVRGARQEKLPDGALFESLRGGMGQLVMALITKVEGRVRIVRTAAEAIEGSRIRAGGEWMAADDILLCCGPVPTARLLAGTESGCFASKIHCSSAVIVALGYRTAELPPMPRGFGFLVPRRERHTVLAATWVSRKFPYRVPPGMFVVRAFVSGQPGNTVEHDVRKDLARIAGFAAEPLFVRVFRWPDSMPQYGIGHTGLITRLRTSLPANVHVAGAYLNGVGMPDCVRSGFDAASSICHRCP